VGTASRRSPATPHRDSTLALVGTRPSETRIHDYDEVILATGRQGSSRPGRLMGWDCHGSCGPMDSPAPSLPLLADERAQAFLHETT
jgi:hypothetical protein